MELNNKIQELINEGIVSKDDFIIEEGNFVAKDKYVHAFVLSEIKASTQEQILEEVTKPEAKETPLKEDYIDGTQMINEVKDIPGQIEKVRSASDLRRQVEDLYNKAEDVLFFFAELQDSKSAEVSGYLVNLQNVITQLGMVKNKMGGSNKVDSSVDF